MRYKVIRKMDGYEIRDYEACVVAQTTVTGTYRESQTNGFRAVADYIFGNNIPAKPVNSMDDVVETGSHKGPERIPMTAPVISERNYVGEQKNDYKISFVMPSKYNMDTLPAPKNQRIQIRQINGAITAVLKFSGYASERRVFAKRQKLRELLSRDNIRANPGYRLAQYDPPWTPPFMRRNEIMIELR
jgi:hypothetical protein